jgi:hypothetical protein
MDNKTVFVVTLKGAGEIKNHTRLLPADIKRALVLVDDESTVETLVRKAAPSLRAGLTEMLQKLVSDGFIHDKANARSSNNIRIATPKPAVSSNSIKNHTHNESDDLDFTSEISEPLGTITAAEQGKRETSISKVELETSILPVQFETTNIKMQAEAKSLFESAVITSQDAEIARLKMGQDAAQVYAEATEAARIKAEREVTKARADLAAARLEAERSRAELEAAKLQSETLAKREAEVVRLREEETAAKAHAEAEARAKRDAETARINAEREAARVRAEAETIRIKAEQEAAKARAELEAARLENELTRTLLEAKSLEAETIAKREVEAFRQKEEQAAVDAQLEAVYKAKQAAEMERLKAEQLAAQLYAEEAEAVRIRAEQDAAKARAELEAARIEADQARAELEAAKIQAEALAKRELESASLREIAVARALADAEAKAAKETEIIRFKAEQEASRVRAEAEALRVQVEQEAVRVETERVQTELAAAKIKAESLAKQEAENSLRIAQAEIAKAMAEAAAVQLRVQQEAERVKAELATAKAKAMSEARARADASARTEALAKAKKEAEAAKLKDEQAAAEAHAAAEAKVRREAEDATIKAAQEIFRLKSEAEEQSRQANLLPPPIESAPTDKEKADVSSARSMIATVLFFDVVGYTKQSISRQIELKNLFNKLVTNFIKDINENQRIILDTGDGAAIGFLQHPEDAIEVALKFRNAIVTSNSAEYAHLNVRMGIHLGPVNIVKDMNGRSNMVGDGINDAQRIMDFSPAGHIYISRAYYEVVSRLNAQYAKLFEYLGVKNDKHKRQHHLYEAIIENSKDKKVAPLSTQGEDLLPPGSKDPLATSSVNLAPFVLNGVEHITTAVPTSSPVTNSGKVGDQSVQAKIDHTQKEIPINPAQADSQEKLAQKMLQEIEAEVHTLVEQKARQESETMRLKTQQEESRLRNEKEARQMAEEQARAWEEAEQRARAQAAIQEKAELQAHQSVKISHEKVFKKHRNPLPLAKVLAGFFGLLLILVAMLPYVLPLQNYVAPLEKILSDQLQQPVHIARIKFALFPVPKLELQDISVGNAKQLGAQKVVLNFDVLSLFSEIKIIKILEINDLTLSAPSFGETLNWLQAAGINSHYPVMRMVLNRARIGENDIALPALNGDADWNTRGLFSKVRLRSEDGKFTMELEQIQSRWNVALHVRESKLPWLPGMLFNDLKTTVEVSENSADFKEIDSQLYGGRLTGQAHLDWQKGWQMQGHLNIKAMPLQDTFPQYGIEGALNGDSSFQLYGTSPQQLSSTPRLEGNFTVEKGLISKIDILETAAKFKELVGGRTHFEELSGSLQMENHNVHFRQLKISTGDKGAMDASGSFDAAADGKLSGRLSVDLKMRGSNAQLILSGTLLEPELHPAK